MIHLNHAGTSWPKPAPVRAAVAEALEASPGTWAARLERDHAAVARAFGVRNPARLLLTPGATSALNVAVSDHTWAPGDRVLIGAFEHHALHRPVQLLARHGVEITIIPPGDGLALAPERLAAELARGKVRLVAAAAASNVTGALLPVATIVRLAREHGALSLIDAAQTAGWFDDRDRADRDPDADADPGRGRGAGPHRGPAADPDPDLDLAAALDADLVAFAGHKGPQAPWGIGGLMVAEHVAMASPRAACEVAGAGPAGPCAAMPGYCDVGSVDRAALAGLAAGLSWLAAPGQSGRLDRARAHVAVLADALRGIPGLTLHGPASPRARMPVLALTADAHPPAALAAALERLGVIASAGLQCAPLAHETLGTLPHGVLRLSAGPATTEADVRQAAAALGECLGSPA